MATVFVVHGAYGNSHENWIPWLKDQLTSDGCNVIAPEFPTPDDQSYENWKEVIDQFEIGEDTILVGHSVAVVFLLRVLEKLSVQVRGAILVSGFLHTLGNDDFDAINTSFYVDNLDWNAIKQHCQTFVSFHSDNDPYVPLEQGQKIADHLAATMHVIPDAGHFNRASGYDTFPELLEAIRGLGL